MPYLGLKGELDIYNSRLHTTFFVSKMLILIGQLGFLRPLRKLKIPTNCEYSKIV